MKPGALVVSVALCVPLFAAADLESARNRQDRPALQQAAQQLSAAAQKQPQNAQAQYRAAEAQSFLAEVAFEQRDKNAAANAAEAGIKAAELAVKLQPQVSENHRILGTLCGQVIPANVLLALRYGRCARESIDRAVQLDPRSARAYLSRGIGNYYLPPTFGGSVESAVRDFQQAIQLDPKLSDAHLWLGLALRKLKRNAEARKEIARSLELNPNRAWAKQQLDKTPAQ